MRTIPAVRTERVAPRGLILLAPQRWTARAMSISRIHNTIRKVTLEGVVTTIAGLAQFDELGRPVGGSANGTGSAARFNQPFDVAVDNGGVIYVADEANNTIRKVTPAGLVTTVAGLVGS